MYAVISCLGFIVGVHKFEKVWMIVLYESLAVSIKSHVSVTQSHVVQNNRLRSSNFLTSTFMKTHDNELKYYRLRRIWLKIFAKVHPRLIVHIQKTFLLFILTSSSLFRVSLTIPIHFRCAFNDFITEWRNTREIPSQCCGFCCYIWYIKKICQQVNARNVTTHSISHVNKLWKYFDNVEKFLFIDCSIVIRIFQSE